LDAEANQSVQDKFAKIITDNGGEIEKTDVWGKRRLAYAIDYKTEGFYVLVNFNANPELPRELERNLRNDERIMRYMVTRKEA
jgi:small subunit ribosomal protein S6